mgnify:CR=1 FL=1
MDEASTYGRTRVAMTVTGSRIKSVALESTFGPMEECTSANGWTIICMAMGFTRGRMGACTRVTTLTIRKVDSVSILGLIVDNTMECGRMESSMEKVSIFCLQECKDVDFGIMEYVRSG